MEKPCLNFYGNRLVAPTPDLAEFKERKAPHTSLLIGIIIVSYVTLVVPDLFVNLVHNLVLISVEAWRNHRIWRPIIIV